jgi:hypothetical protein
MGHGGRRDPSEYVSILAEVYFDQTKRRNGVRPCDDEKFPSTMKIECARDIREYPVGTIVRLDVVGFSLVLMPLQDADTSIRKNL